MVSRARPVSTRISRSEWLARRCSNSCRICKVSFFLWGTAFLPRIDWKEDYPETFANRRSGRPWPKSLDQFNTKNDSQQGSGSSLNRQYHIDNLGSVQATTDGSQAVETRYVTDAWGNVL